MRIGIDVTWLGTSPAGVGTMTGEVIAELTQRPDVELVLFRAGRGVGKHWRLYRQIRAAHVDVLWQTGGWLPLLLPRRLCTIQTVHDLISFAHPEWFPQGRCSRAWSEHVRVAWALRRATVVHAISAWTASQVRTRFPATHVKLFMAYQGVAAPTHIDPALVPTDVVHPYVLLLGTVEPRKNIPFACEVFLEFAQQYPDPHLVIAGQVGWRAQESIRAIQQLQVQLPGRVHLLGYLSDAHKWALIQGAAAMWMVSHAEGFGRPLVEAMQVGTPVIATAHSAMQEVVEDAGILVPVGNKTKTARALWRALYHPLLPGRLMTLGHERARRFSVAQCVDRVLAAAIAKKIAEPTR